MTENGYRPGTIVNPQKRISDEQVKILHKASMEILDDPGIVCFNEEAADYLDKAGCKVKKDENWPQKAWQVRIPENTVMGAVESAPETVVLGARDPGNRLHLDTDVPRLYFGTGSETNIYLKTRIAEFQQVDDPNHKIRYPVFSEDRGTVTHLCESAKLCNALENVDFYIRNVNLQDPDITEDNKDVNVFLASLMYMTKHVQAGITNLDRLDDVLKMAALIAGGEDKLKENPIVSFITCLVKSPLQMVEDTTQKLIGVARRGFPVVVSSSPQGGSTAPILEEGMVSMINAEILAGITLAQVVNPGTPVLYGAVPVRARLDTLHDLYGAPEFVHYNVDCVQMARSYRIPVYSTAGVGDTKVPGMQAMVEKILPYLGVASSGAQYIHYALGLMDKTNVFCPLQAVLDDASIGLVRDILRRPLFGKENAEKTVKEVRKVMASSTRLFARYIRKPLREGLVTKPYAFESTEDKDEVMVKAAERLDEILSGPDDRLDEGMLERIYKEVPGPVARERFLL